MKSSIGNKIKLSVFGESHGAAVGCLLEGLPAGFKIDFDALLVQMSRRAPGKDKTATTRKEADIPEIISGVLDGVTTGAPLAIIIKNNDTKSHNYDNLRDNPRPSHSDYAASVKFGGYNDIRGGGHFSARLTAPIVAAGAICRQILKEQGITIGGHIQSIGNVCETSFDPVNVTAEQLEGLSSKLFALNNPEAEGLMRKEIEDARLEGDSVGGSVELVALGLPVGLGNPMFYGVENVVANILYGIPAVKGVSFGAGFGYASMRGSQANDQMYYDENGKVKCYTNNCGGITGGITNGMPLLVTVALKPTPSIAKQQKTVNLETGENATLIIEGRHDPCIVPRALPVLEAALSIALLDLLSEEGKL
ncbi:MAG: chorismate synthase [Clostridia bacterium]|nr:chorismate synthase [Clostridia bacterium]